MARDFYVNPDGITVIAALGVGSSDFPNREPSASGRVFVASHRWAKGQIPTGYYQLSIQPNMLGLAYRSVAIHEMGTRLGLYTIYWAVSAGIIPHLCRRFSI